MQIIPKIVHMFLFGTLVCACAQEGEFRLQVGFPDDAARTAVSELSVQVFEPGGRTCADLMAGADTSNMTAQASLIVQWPLDGTSPALESVPRGVHLFWVEGRDSSGSALLHGCRSAEIRAGQRVDVRVELTWLCQPRPNGEVMGNGTDDDCDGLTDECSADSDCDDHNTCTYDFCTSDACQHTNISEGLDCDDGNPCTVGDSCQSGACAAEPRDCSAFDGQCFMGVCHPETGVCEPVAVEDGRVCNDGRFCTVDDACSQGECMAGPDRDCSDGDECTIDACVEVEEVCSHTLEPRPGEEGPPGDPNCNNGLDDDCDGLPDMDDNNCVNCVEALDCDDGNTCTVDDCVDQVCQNVVLADGSDCDDGLACTPQQSCSGGVCQGQELDCSHLNESCRFGACDPDSGECQAIPLTDATSCDDGLWCTDGDRCLDGECQSPARDCDDGDHCTVDTCNEGRQECEYTHQDIPGAEGPPGDESCLNELDDDCDGSTDLDDGSCYNCTSASECDDSNVCTSDSCENGLCVNAPLADGSSCDDGQFCTVDSCQAGACQSQPRDCSSVAGECQQGLCDEDSDQCSPADLPDGALCGPQHCSGLGLIADACLAQVCTDQMLLESCDDDNPCTIDSCDGLTGCAHEIIPGCELPLGAVDDYDVAADGSLFVLETSTTAVYGRCYLSDGSVRRPQFPIFSTGAADSVIAGKAQVVTARDTGLSLVTWMIFDTPGNNNTRHIFSQLYDGDCRAVGSLIDWPPGPSRNENYDTAIDGLGNFALFWQGANGSASSYISFFDATATQVGSDVLVNANNYCRYPYGFHVAMNPSTGAGVVTCQLSWNTPIRYRRFDASHAFLDSSSMPAFPHTDDHGSYHQSHVVGINDDGVIALQWQNSREFRYEYDLLSEGGSLIAHGILGDTLSSTTNCFRYPHQKVQVLGSDFLMRNHSTPTTFWRISPAGEMLGCDQSALDKESLRSSGSELFQTSSERVVKDQLDFTRSPGCAPDTCGNGDPDPMETCDDGNLVPYDGCNSYCQLEACGDGLVTGSEQCDDGNAIPLDGCAPDCTVDAQVPAVDQYSPADTYDVAQDGSLIMLRRSGMDLFATCYKPDRTLRRARFPLDLPAPDHWDGSVAITPDGSRSLVAWRATNNVIKSVVLDENCMILRPTQSHWTGYYYPRTAAAADYLYLAARTNSQVSLMVMDHSGVQVDGDYVVGGSSSLYGHQLVAAPAGGPVLLSWEDFGNWPYKIYFHRFLTGTGFLDPVPNELQPDALAWSNSHLSGINNNGDIAIAWRDEYPNYCHAVFYDGITLVNQVTYSTRVRPAEWEYAWDAFRIPDQRMPLKGDNFIMGESYTSDVFTNDDIIYFEIAPDGMYVDEFETNHTVPHGNTARLDGAGVSYFRQAEVIYFGPNQL